MSTTLPTVQSPATLDGVRPREFSFGKGRQAFKWIDYEAPTDEEIDALGRLYNFHPLTIEDAKTFDQRAKLLDFANYIFLSVHTLSLSGDQNIRDRELEVFLRRDYLITIHRDPLGLLERVRRRFESDDSHIELGPDYLLYAIIDEMVDAIFPLLDSFDEEIDRLEDETISHATPETLQRIFRLKQDLILMRRSVAPMRDVTNALASTRYELIDEKTSLYYRDVYDHLSRIYELIETQRDLLGNALDTYLSVVSNRLNEVMKRLTVIATIFLPISFIVGLGGINFPQFPFGSTIIFWILMASLLITPLAMIWYFRKKGWY